MNTTVTRLILNSDHTQVDEAFIESLGLTVRGKRFVIVSGVRYSPQILFRSGIGDRASIERLGASCSLDIPGVGRHFHDEWAFSVSFAVNSTNTTYWTFSDSKLNRDQMYLIKWSTGAQGKNFTDVQLYLRSTTKNSLDDYLPQFFQIGATENNDFVIRVALFQNDTFGDDSGVFPVGLTGKYIGKFVTKVKMFSDKQRFSRFLQGAVSGYNKAMEIIELIRTQPQAEAVLRVAAISSTAKLIQSANRGIDEFTKQLWDWGNVLALHGGGTCGIGRVVDSNLKIFHLENAYIGDMSVFPFPVDAYPTATLFALGERLAAHLLSVPDRNLPPLSASNSCPGKVIPF